MSSSCDRAPGHPVVLLAAHGTRDPDGARESLAFAEQLAARLGPEIPLVPCFLELTDPSILDTITQQVQAGARELLVLPLMLFGAAHVKNDVPAAIAVARRRFPDVTIQYGAPFGVQPELLDVVDDRLTALESTLAAFPRERTAILVVERGSSDPDANAQVFHLARMIWEGRGFGWVEPCFIGITRPSLPDGLRRCLALGAERIIILPYFLFTGVLVRRIAQIVNECAASLPGVEVHVAEHLGSHPRLLDLAVRRMSEALGGNVTMRCDCCVYRAPLIGFGHRVGQPPSSDDAHGLREGGRARDHRH